MTWILGVRITSLQHALPSASSAQASQLFPSLIDESRTPCSGNGIRYQGDLTCFCHACWSGPDCSVQEDIKTCMVNAESGSPFLFEDYWVAHPEAEVRIKPSYQEGYGWYQPQLERAIRAIHAQVGNAVTDDRHIVIGMGSQQVLTAAFFAVSNASRSPEVDPTKICAETPYYNSYPRTAAWFSSSLFEWSNTTDLEANAASPVIQVMTSPNNPDGSMRNKTVPGAFGIYDHAYYWPHFTPISAAVEYGDEDIAVFTLSKLTGHAGSRIGWGIVKDPKLAEMMQTYIVGDSGYVQENQLRATHLLHHALADQGGLLAYAREHMEHRWKVLHEVVSKSSRLSLQALGQAQLDKWTGTHAVDDSVAARLKPFVPFGRADIQLLLCGPM
ncbi:hypothetical protein WJX84_001268 [Apatococcus fuscideae]|uniref:Alliinase C-terminal domain-containing protein n=1 Tax=Apatococcus fuscideae TaxID=2026836 RepID=A0AAW1SP86_9CHLO